MVPKLISVVHRSNTQWRERSTAASAPSPSGLPNSPKARQRVSLDARRTMVKAYVKKYREANEGKFPSPTGTVKEFGGSYYVIKKIVQELEYQSKSGLSDGEAATSKRSQSIKKRKPVIEIGEIPCKVTVDCGSDDVVEPVATSDSLSSGTLLLKEEREEQIAVDEIHGVKTEEEKDLTEKDGNTSILEAEKGSTDSGDVEMQEKQHQESPESEKSVKGTGDSELPQKSSSLWENLKSFADGIISIWRK